MFKLCPLPAQGISRYSPDVMKNYSRIAMPIAFLAMHEEKGWRGHRTSRRSGRRSGRMGLLVMKEGSDRTL